MQHKSCLQCICWSWCVVLHCVWVVTSLRCVVCRNRVALRCIVCGNRPLISPFILVDYNFSQVWESPLWDILPAKCHCWCLTQSILGSDHTVGWVIWPIKSYPKWLIIIIIIITDLYSAFSGFVSPLGPKIQSRLK